MDTLENQTLTSETIAVVGASGKTGERVLSRLKSIGCRTRSLSRTAKVNFDWSDRSTWANALQGVTSAYVAYYPDLAVPRAESDIQTFVEVAKAQGVSHIVLLSGRGEEGAERAEDVVINSGLDWNIVRASWFMQNFSESFMLEGVQAGRLVLPIPQADEPFIDVDDIAEIAVAALTRPDLRNTLFEVTGPDIISFENCLETISDATGRNIQLSTLPVETYLAAASADGLDEEIAWLLNELFSNVLDGRNEFTTDTIERVLGRPARRFSDYVLATAKTGIWDAPVTETEPA